jgi:8-oxo-dGTP pyrophosphatase MutT (NUDIX family)
VLLFKVVDVRGGGWHPVTGGVDDSETFLDGAKRELEEETGFDAKKHGTWVDLKHESHFEGRWGLVEEHSFLFVLDGKRVEPKLDPSEHVIYEWVEVHDAQERLGFGGQQNALKLVSDILKVG